MNHIVVTTNLVEGGDCAIVRTWYCVNYLAVHCYTWFCVNYMAGLCYTMLYIVMEALNA